MRAIFRRTLRAFFGGSEVRPTGACAWLEQLDQRNTGQQQRHAGVAQHGNLATVNPTAAAVPITGMAVNTAVT
jgi:hypothetical protein